MRRMRRRGNGSSAAATTTTTFAAAEEEAAGQQQQRRRQWSSSTANTDTTATNDNDDHHHFSNTANTTTRSRGNHERRNARMDGTAAASSSSPAVPSGGVLSSSSLEEDGDREDYSCDDDDLFPTLDDASADAAAAITFLTENGCDVVAAAAAPTMTESTSGCAARNGGVDGGNSRNAGDGMIAAEEDNHDGSIENDDILLPPPVILLPPSPTRPMLLDNNITADDESRNTREEKVLFNDQSSWSLLEEDGNPAETSIRSNHRCFRDTHNATATTALPLPTTPSSTAAALPRRRRRMLLRRHPTGLANLGNTCFLNSTLQCLAHTPPLRHYFLSGIYKRDLNETNPLGTGGELAREFASLLRELWLVEEVVEDEDATGNNMCSSSRSGGNRGGGDPLPPPYVVVATTKSGNGIYASSRMYSPGNGGSYPGTAAAALFRRHHHYDDPPPSSGGGGAPSSSSSIIMAPPAAAAAAVTHPRSFKATLGKHAPRFVGYDQHDSQELAVYLLDALHEDTNHRAVVRGTTKPSHCCGAEPERQPQHHGEQSTTTPTNQEDDDDDDDRAERAWEAHLRRDDSFVVRNFVGQIQSRLRCPNIRRGATTTTTTNLAPGEEEDGKTTTATAAAACGRASTTFDPCMYLSVPIPGGTDRVVKVVFVPRGCFFGSSSSSSSSSWWCGRSDDDEGKSTSRRSRIDASAEFTIRLCKNSTLRSLLRQVVESARECYGCADETELEEEDVQLVDIFNNQIWSYYDDLDRAIDGIKDSDVTYAYQLFPLKRVREEVARYRRRIDDCSSTSDVDDAGWSGPASSSTTTLASLDAATKAQLDANNQWENKLLKFVAKPTAVCHMLNEKKSNHKERLDFYGSLIKFIRRCQQCPDAAAAAGKSIVDGDDEVMASPSSASSPTKRLSSSISQPTLEEVSFTSSQFKGVRTPRDLAVLEYCTSKYLARINKLNRIASHRSRIAEEYKMAASSASTTDDIINKHQDGLVVQVKIRKNDSPSFSSYSSAYNYGNCYSRDLAWRVVGDVPMVVRISPTLTVSGLRQLLGRRLLRSCGASNGGSSGNRHHHHHLSEDYQTHAMEEEEELGGSSSPGMLVRSAMQEVAFSWEDDTSHGSGARGGGWNGNVHPREFGSVTLDHFSSTHSMKAPSCDGVANGGTSNDEAKEMELVASIVENRSTILVNWPPQYNDVLDEFALCAKEEYLTIQQRKEMAEEDEDDDENEDDVTLFSTTAASSFSSSNNGNKNQRKNGKMKKKKKKGISIMDCIHKYCEMEQLDESDMWYCDHCKEHVRAWKQFHLYRTPPILIVHLKRFHYSSTTHRRDKIDTLIDFPLTDLDLRSVVKHNHWEVGQEPIYDCYAVSNHYGGLGGGHYTAYARWGGGGGGEKDVGGEDGSKSSWCLFDDSRVTACVDVSEVVSNAAYCLYYMRKDVAFDDDYFEDEDKNNGQLLRTLTTKSTSTKQLGVNHPNGANTEKVTGLVSSMIPVSHATNTLEDGARPLLLPPPHPSFEDVNSNDATMEEVVDERRSSSSSTASYVTPSTSLHDEDDDGMMNDII